MGGVRVRAGVVGVEACRRVVRGGSSGSGRFSEKDMVTTNTARDSERLSEILSRPTGVRSNTCHSRALALDVKFVMRCQHVALALFCPAMYICISLDGSRVGGHDLVCGCLAAPIGDKTIVAWVPPQVRPDMPQVSRSLVFRDFQRHCGKTVLMISERFSEKLYGPQVLSIN